MEQKQNSDKQQQDFLQTMFEKYKTDLLNEREELYKVKDENLKLKEENNNRLQDKFEYDNKIKLIEKQYKEQIQKIDLYYSNMLDENNKKNKKLLDLIDQNKKYYNGIEQENRKFKKEIALLKMQKKSDEYFNDKIIELEKEKMELEQRIRKMEERNSKQNIQIVKNSFSLVAKKKSKTDKRVKFKNDNDGKNITWKSYVKNNFNTFNELPVDERIEIMRRFPEKAEFVNKIDKFDELSKKRRQQTQEVLDKNKKWWDDISKKYYYLPMFNKNQILNSGNVMKYNNFISVNKK